MIFFVWQKEKIKNMNIIRTWGMPNSETFTVKPIGNFVNRYLEKSQISIDPFARNKKLATYTNDLNPNTLAEYHLDVYKFLELMVEKNIIADLIIFDPPYSPTQIKMSYQSIGLKNENSDFHRVARWSKEKDLVDKILKPNGIFLQFGWNTAGMGLKRNYQIEEIMICCHGAGHNDTICMAERKL